MGQNGTFRRFDYQANMQKVYLQSNGSVIPVVRGVALYLVRNEHSFKLIDHFNGLPKDKIIGMLYVPRDGEEEKHGKRPLHLQALTPKRNRPLHLIGVGKQLKTTGEIVISATYSALAFDYNTRLFIVRAEDIDFEAENNLHKENTKNKKSKKNNKRKYYREEALKLRPGASIDSIVITEHGRLI